MIGPETQAGDPPFVRERPEAHTKYIPKPQRWQAIVEGVGRRNNGTILS
jgi:hypothetical protein